MLPGLLASGGGPGGFLGSLKNAVGHVLADVGSNRVNSGADFGRSLARGAASLFGIDSKGIPENAANRMDQEIASVANEASSNAADRDIVRMEPLRGVQRPLPFKGDRYGGRTHSIAAPSLGGYDALSSDVLDVNDGHHAGVPGSNSRPIYRVKTRRMADGLKGHVKTPIAHKKVPRSKRLL